MGKTNYNKISEGQNVQNPQPVNDKEGANTTPVTPAANENDGVNTAPVTPVSGDDDGINTNPVTPTANTTEGENEKTPVVPEGANTNPVAPEVPVITGVVSDCKRLRIRKKPSDTSDIISIMDAGSEVFIDKDDSTNEWYKVRTKNGITGYCMKKYITV